MFLSVFAEILVWIAYVNKKYIIMGYFSSEKKCFGKYVCVLNALIVVLLTEHISEPDKTVVRR